jgi:hypothetical protein
VENRSQTVNVIVFVKMLLDCYSLIIEIYLSPDNEMVSKENLPKIKSIRTDLDKCLSILSEHANEKGTLHFFTQIFNILNTLDHCIWSLSRQKTFATAQLEVGRLRDELNILIKLSLEGSTPYIIKH